ncbi:alpha/beta fold hydrolase [Pedobacter petrophilus]|uniref:Alpha/beta fold hydrolase n=1 Tax=Pedobacter petrophilus TaxID=1908241 RepID=A0A7K0FVB8_9SPHI|nr:alpha/beta hydrolase [Pedobacter petrophilus]MRX75508.1 alpha/beta fold hydrolase [Pedobacter petrophilus]
MKRLKQLTNSLKTTAENPDDGQMREFIFYSPKMPLRIHQEELVAAAKIFTLAVYDPYFTQSNLEINCFSWGIGKIKILLTHGWASKALDFYELIVELLKMDDVEVIAFDAPGNGSSGSDLSNLMFYTDAVKSIASNYTQPDFVIGHSLGSMANVIALQDLNLSPKMLISIAPLIRLKEKFAQSLTSVGIAAVHQDRFFDNFAKEFPVRASYFNLVNLYEENRNFNHFVAFDPEDDISTYPFLKEFLDKFPDINATAYEGVGHYKILKSNEVINDIVLKITAAK